ncbi:NAD(P)-dependent iron-only hydrogenase diaphorase component flavoprotein [Longilinea arvoryzae]|uniref:NAD(P)-dependent iron-only hydrogenase diaphorase component flavoprotein n=1 Tax=Longilinea arvoryzae TaxID=360412 RepID=A0A0S7BLV4_9CHLR|nr:NADH-quinone oxidoreductase subunit NuoF [Longilinea arvoryzae]GAP14929.1 NAD(P)-dependent iron-only hydrogenase diaphorase component flavoprotein [Longilinea arvoryzae]
MKTYRAMVLVSGDPLSLERGAKQVYAKLEEEIAAFGLTEEVSLGMVNEIGRHDADPLVVVYPEAVIYGPVTIDNVHTLVEEHLYKGRIAAGMQAPIKEMTGRIAWLSARKGTLPAEQRIVLERAGIIDPESIEDYIVHDGYQALVKTLTTMTPADVIAELEKSGLRGRGGAGFPTGTKWKFVSKANGKKKYVVCNADESEPGTFKDRLILEGDPHSIIEAMTIAGYTIGASEGYIYIRGEYTLAQERMFRAILKAREMGFLGKNIFDTDFSFDIHIHSGAGAYICGEETALIESIEGKPGIPRARPPFPTTNGLWGMPTLVNNVETLANVPAILRHGAIWYRSFGTPSSPGTKVYTMLGNVNVTGVVEVPMGITLREIVTIYAKGMKKGSSFKLAQTGGSSGSVIPASLQDTPMDFDSFSKAGVALGSGALLICDEDTCVVDLAKTLLNFFRVESCGKCNPCRIGTQRAFDILTSITEGTASLKDLDTLLELSSNMAQMSNCGLGQTAGTPLTDILKYFRAEVEAHIRLKVCPAGVCPMKPYIKKEKAPQVA